jgi:integrase
MVITINAIMDYAVNIGVIEHNPLSKIGKAFPAEKNEPRATLQKERLPEFLSAWNELSLWEPSKLALLFQIITMVRPSEAGGALWNEIDFDNSIWQIPASRMKGKRPHVVPLSSQAINVLKEAEKWKRCDYVFPHGEKKISRSHDVRLRPEYTKRRLRADCSSWVQGVGIYSFK